MQGPTSRWFGAVTIFMLVLAFLALDDITTDNATAFPLEYTVLVACAAWLFFVGVRLLRYRHHVLGGVSVIAVVAAIWAQRAIGPGIVPGLWTEYVVTVGAFFWFCALAVMLLAGVASRPARRPVLERSA